MRNQNIQIRVIFDQRIKQIEPMAASNSRSKYPPVNGPVLHTLQKPIEQSDRCCRVHIQGLDLGFSRAHLINALIYLGCRSLLSFIEQNRCRSCHQLSCVLFLNAGGIYSLWVSNCIFYLCTTLGMGLLLELGWVVLNFANSEFSRVIFG